MPAPCAQVVRAAWCGVRDVWPLLRVLPLVARSCGPVLLTGRVLASGYAYLCAWWLAMGDGVITPAERRDIWLAVLAVEARLGRLLRRVVAVCLERMRR